MKEKVGGVSQEDYNFNVAPFIGKTLKFYGVLSYQDGWVINEHLPMQCKFWEISNKNQKNLLFLLIYFNDIQGEFCAN